MSSEQLKRGDHVLLHDMLIHEIEHQVPHSGDGRFGRTYCHRFGTAGMRTTAKVDCLLCIGGAR